MQESPPPQAVPESTSKPEPKLEIGYKIGLAILICLAGRLAQKNTGGLAPMLGFMLGQIAVCFVIALFATGIAALMTKMDRSILFAKCLFVVMLILVGGMTLADFASSSA